jgi:hypothetical protein
VGAEDEAESAIRRPDSAIEKRAALVIRISSGIMVAGCRLDAAAR